MGIALGLCHSDEPLALLALQPFVVPRDSDANPLITFGFGHPKTLDRGTHNEDTDATGGVSSAPAQSCCDTRPRRAARSSEERDLVDFWPVITCVVLAVTVLTGEDRGELATHVQSVFRRQLSDMHAEDASQFAKGAQEDPTLVVPE